MPSLAQRTGQLTPLDVQDRALRLFTGRTAILHELALQVNEAPPGTTYTFLAGEGGNGKTTLLHYVARHLSRQVHPSRWKEMERLWQLGEEKEWSLRLQSANGVTPFPTVLLDLHAHAGQLGEPTSVVGGLLHLRRHLGAWRDTKAAISPLTFPAFDYGLLLYLHRTHQLSPSHLSALYPEEREFVAEVLDVLSGTVAATLLNLAAKLVERQARLPYTLSRAAGVPRETFEALARLTEVEMLEALPRLLAEDVSASMAGATPPPRVLLLVDGYEAFNPWNDAPGKGADRDRWLRQLLLHLDDGARVLVVITGRSAPGWSAVSVDRIPADALNVRRIGPFTDAEAHAYVMRASDSAVFTADGRDQLVELARISTDAIHPYLLALGTDLVRLALQQGKPVEWTSLMRTETMQQRQRRVLDCLLRWADAPVEDATRCLAAARNFDENLYRLLGNQMHFDVTHAAFERLTQFSFVWQTSTGVYRIHDLMRRLLFDEHDPRTIEANEALATLYGVRAEKGDEVALAEGLYHYVRGDYEAGLEALHAAVLDASEYGFVGLGDAVLALLNDLPLVSASHRALTSSHAAHYLHRVGRNAEALAFSKRCEGHFRLAIQDSKDDKERASYQSDLASELLKRSEIYQKLHDRRGQLASLQKARVLCTEAASVLPHQARVRYTEGQVYLYTIKAVGAGQGYGASSARWLDTAEGAFNAALTLHPDDFRPYVGLGEVFHLRGMLLARDGHVDAAAVLAAYTSGIAFTRRAIDLNPRQIGLHSNMGLMLVELGSFYEREGRGEEAEASYQKAADAHRMTIQQAQHPLFAYTNLAIACCQLGSLYTRRAPPDFYATRRALRQGALAAEEALRIQPQHESALHVQAQIRELIRSLPSL